MTYLLGSDETNIVYSRVVRGAQGRLTEGRGTPTLKTMKHVRILYSNLYNFKFFKKECLYRNVHMSVCAWRGQKGVTVPLELELQVVVNNLTWILETELKCSTVKLSLPPHDLRIFPDGFIPSWELSITKMGIIFLPMPARVFLLFRDFGGWNM